MSITREEYGDYRFVWVLIDRGPNDRERTSVREIIKHCQRLDSIDVLVAKSQNSFDWKRANVGRIR